MISTILKALAQRAKRTSAELKADLDKIDVQALETKVTQIEARRRALLLTGTDAELQAVTQDLAAANLEAERAQAAVDELNRLIVEAEERERLANVEATAAGAREVQGRMMAAYIEIDGLAFRLAELLNALDTDWRVIQAANQTVIDAGRADLKTSHPLGLLAGHLGCTVQNLPHVGMWSIHGYQANTTVKEQYRLGRMRELLPPAARKAAA